MIQDMPLFFAACCSSPPLDRKKSNLGELEIVEEGERWDTNHRHSETGKRGSKRTAISIGEGHRVTGSVVTLKRQQTEIAMEAFLKQILEFPNTQETDELR